MRKFVFSCLCLTMLASASFAADAVTDAFEPPQSSGGGTSSSGLPRLGIGVKASLLLGVGVEAATSITRKSNIRGGVNFFSYDFDQTKDNANYALKLHLRSVQATYDWFPFGGGFHLSPGVLLYNGNKVDGAYTTPGGQTFSLGNQTYTSKTTDPVIGTATVSLDKNKVSPMFMLGWGNLLKRGNGHFSVNFEFGAAYTGSPKSTLNLKGTACLGAQQAVNCLNSATDPTVQSNIHSEESKINDAIKALQLTPIISLGFGWKF